MCIRDRLYSDSFFSRGKVKENNNNLPLQQSYTFPDMLRSTENFVGHFAGLCSEYITRTVSGKPRYAVLPDEGNAESPKCRSVILWTPNIMKILERKTINQKKQTNSNYLVTTGRWLEQHVCYELFYA